MQFVDAIKYKKEVEELYVSAFPKDERAPIKLLYKRLNRKENKFYAIEENGEFIGLVYLITKGDIAYIFFFAIVEDKRGQGYGTRTLSLIKEMYKNYRICLMIEDTNIVNSFNYNERIKRLHFYVKNGFKQLNVKVNEAGVDYELLSTGSSVTQKEFLSLMRSYVNWLLYKILYRKTKIEK